MDLPQTLLQGKKRQGKGNKREICLGKKVLWNNNNNGIYLSELHPQNSRRVCIKKLNR